MVKRKVFIPIGAYGAFTPENARTVAKDYIRRLDQGENPYPKHNLEPVKITIADLYRQYISGKQTPLSDSTLYAYKSWMNNHFKDWLTLPAETITGSMVLDRLSKMEKDNGITQAASSIKLLRGLYRMGISGLIPDRR